MTLYVDTSALVRRYLHDRHRPMVLDAMAVDEPWCASALVRTEAQLALHRASGSARQQTTLWRALRDEWDAFWVVPLDDRCMARAVELGAVGEAYLTELVHQRPHTWAGDVERLFQLLEELGESGFRVVLQLALMQRTFGAEYVVRLVGRMAAGPAGVAS